MKPVIDALFEEDFYRIVNRSGEGINRIVNLYAKGTMVYGTVRSQSAMSFWTFKLDFNDYGRLTGKYWLFTDNPDSGIPQIVAARISHQIVNYPDGADFAVNVEPYEEKSREVLNEPVSARCPYCGEKNYNEDAKFCMYCGRRFRI